MKTWTKEDFTRFCRLCINVDNSLSKKDYDHEVEQVARFDPKLAELMKANEKTYNAVHQHIRSNMELLPKAVSQVDSTGCPEDSIRASNGAF